MKRRVSVAGALLSIVSALTAHAAVAENLPGVVSATTASAPTLPSFDNRYQVDWGGVGVGSMDLVQQPLPGHPGCYRVTSVSHPSWLASLLYGAPRQSSEFCVVDGRIRSQRYRFTLPGDDDSYTLRFDWARHTVTDDHGRVRTIPDDAIDGLALQQAVRLWVLAHAGDASPPQAAFTMVDDRNLTHYRLQLAGRQGIDTPAGHFDALLVERVDDPHKLGRYWLAPARGDLPVASETRNGDRPSMRLSLLRY